ncbi:MAG: (2Fe-2S)-binding protein [Acidobacteria bacterium]|nr:(2Fe-2S)-binding protein [Acidobacteriota bacterium]
MPKPKEPEANGALEVSRRGFLTGAGAVISSSLVAGTESLRAAPESTGAAVAGPGKVDITLTVNGAEKTLALEPRVTLLDALRFELDLTGAKKVCDRGTCGACTVTIDGKPAYACSVLAIQVEGKDIRTVEGLAQGDRLHPIQQAFVDNDAQQCGYCTPGFVMACKAFLDKNPNPTLDQVRTGLGGNLCRCGTYVGVAQAVLQSSERQTGSLVGEGRNHA